MTMTAFSQQFYFYLVLISSTSSLFLMMNIVYAGPTGLTLKLIHIDSPESPLYPGNLTQEERIHRDFQRSEAHLQKLTTLIKSSWQVRNYNSSSSSSSNSYPVLAEGRRPPLGYDGVYYLAQVGIGTFAQQTSKTYFLIVDTGSSISWLQCRGCNPCFPQIGEPYPATDSATYSKIPYSQQPHDRHPLCRDDLVDPDGFCEYQITYGDKSHSSGVLATETLTVNVDMHGLERIPNFVFGCGLEQKNFKTGHGQEEVELAGILGLGGADYSFVKQLEFPGQRRFAYCLQLWSDQLEFNTYLRLGSDADHIRGAPVQITDFFHGRGDTLYYVILIDISIGEAPVEFPPNSFTLTNEGIGGCVFDSGAPLTFMAPELYDLFEQHMIQYFTALDIEKADKEDSPYDTCFIKRDGFTNYPSITFHFKGADFEIEPKAAFYIDDVLFCSTIVGYDKAPDATFIPFDVVFGATQQANHRVLHDLDNLKISWTKEQCVTPL